MSKLKLGQSKKILAILLCMVLIAAGILGLNDTAHAELLLAQTTGTPTSTIRSEVYQNGLVVAVGDIGIVQTSPDGVTWTTQTSNTTVTLHSVTYGNSMLVAVGDSGTIITSPDGITWTARTSGTSKTLYSVAYGNGSFVAVGAYYACMSTDGITWTEVTYFMSSANYSYTGAPQSFTASATSDYTVQLWGASGGGGTNMKVTHKGLGGYSTGTLSLKQGDVINVYVGGAGIWGNDSGVSSWGQGGGGWNGGGNATNQGYWGGGYGGGGATDLRTVGGAWNNSDGLKSRLIVAGGGGGASNAYNADGIGGSGGYGGGLSGGYGYYRSPGVTSEHPGDQTSGYTLGQGQSGNGCNGGAGGGYYGGCASNDAGSGGSSSDDIYYASGAGGGSGYIGGVTNGSTIAGNAVMPSTTGSTETGHNGNGYAKILWSSTNLCSVTYGNNLFVAVDSNGTVYASSDGSSWTTKSSKTGINKVSYINNSFYAVGQNGLLMSSSDLTSWTTLTSGTGNNLNDISFGNGIYTVVGSNEEVLASKNATTWKEQKNDAGNDLYAVNYTSNGVFVAVGVQCITLTIGDKTPPVISLSQDSTRLTNQPVGVTANITDDNDFTSYWSTDPNAKDTGTKFSGSFSAPDSGTYYVYAVDSYGNGATASITITNIDKIPPVVTIVPSTTSPAQSVELDMTVTDNVSAGNGFIYFGSTYYTNGSDIVNYCQCVVGGASNYGVNSNGIYYGYEIDAAGNIGYSSITVTNIDTTPPTLDLAVSTTELVRKPVTITATASDTNGVTTYWSMNQSAGTSGTQFTGSFDATTNGIYYVSAVDAAGNITNKSVDIENVNMTPESKLTEATVSATNQPVTITTSVKSIYSYKTYWSTKPDAKETGTEFTNSFIAPCNGTYYVYAVDTDGKNSTIGITVSNIDTTPPDIAFSTSTSNYTNKPITVSVNATDSNSVTTYWSTSSTAGASGTQFNRSFTATANGTYYVYAVDAAGNGATNSVTISNIDTTAPTLGLTESPVSPSQYITITAATSDDNGLVTTYWSTSPTADASGKQFSGSFDAASNGTYYIYAVDAAGNGTTSSIVVSNISIKDDTGKVDTGKDTNNTAGNGNNVPIVATTDPIVFKVTVPLSLPADVDKYGNVSVADNAVITNESSYGCVKVNQITDTGANGWSLIGFASDMNSLPVGTKQFGFMLNNNIADNSTGLINISDMNPINVGNSQPLNYMLKLPPQPRGLNNETVSSLVIVIDWYK